MAKGKYQEWLEPEGSILLEGWARDGLTDEQIAKNMGIAVKTLYRWKNDHCQICQALKKGKEISDYEIENALYEKARNGDVTAIIFYLKNRRPGKWRDKKDMDISVQPVDKTIEELDDYICKKKQKDT